MVPISVNRLSRIERESITVVNTITVAITECVRHTVSIVISIEIVAKAVTICVEGLTWVCWEGIDFVVHTITVVVCVSVVANAVTIHVRSLRWV